MWGIRKINYSPYGFRMFDGLVYRCNNYETWIIWDMQGAQGGQKTEIIISDSDGEVRIWTEKKIYWPRGIDLSHKIALRYKDQDCNLLNDPLLIRYGLDPGLLHEHYTCSPIPSLVWVAWRQIRERGGLIAKFLDARVSGPGTGEYTRSSTGKGYRGL